MFIQIYRDDYKPKEICSDCLLKLDSFCDFITTCQGANEKFEAILYEYGDAKKKWQGRSYSPQKSGVIVPSKGDCDGLSDCSDIVMMVQYKESNFLPLETLESLNEQNMLNVVNDVDHSCVRKKQEVCQQNETVLRHSGDVRGTDSNYYSQQMQKNYFYPSQNADCEPAVCSVFAASAYDHSNIVAESNKRKGSKRLISVDDVYKSVQTTVRGLDETVKTKLPDKSLDMCSLKLYSCLTCEKKFRKKSSLNVHMSTHTNIRPYICLICSKSFAVKWELTNHQKIHTGIHKCQYCPKAFAVKSKLYRHERIHTNERPFVCKVGICGKRFSDKRNLIAHEITHSDARDFVCDFCRKSYRTKSHLNDHKKAHEKASFKCELCNAEYKWKASLLMHMKKHKGYMCMSCGKDCEKLGALIKHRKLCVNKKNEVIDCV